MRFQRIDSLRKSPLIGMVLVTGITLSASGVNFIAQALLAYRFGLGVSVDSYAFSLSMPIFIAGLIGSIVSYVAVPLIAVESENPARQAQVCTSVFITVGLVALLLVVGAVPGIWMQIAALPKSSPIAMQPNLRLMMALAWLTGAMQIVSAVLVAQLTACRRPIIASLLALLPGSGTIVFLLVMSDPAVVTASFGFLTGSAAAAAGGYLLQRKMLRARIADIDLKNGMANLIRRGFWAALALTCFSSFAVIDSFWAARMPEGSLASLGYVQRLINGVSGLVVAGPSALYVPRFAALLERGERAAFARLLTRTLLFVALLGGTVALLLNLYSNEIVTVLFRRGAFSNSDVALVGSLLRAMVPGVVTMLAVVILMRAIFCMKNTQISSAVIGTSWPVLYFTVSGLLMHQGAIGIARSYTIAWVSIGLLALAYTFAKIRRP